MQVLITGGTGFLGSNIIKRLVDDDTCERIIVPTLDIRQKTSLKALGINSNKVDLVKGDVRDFDFLRLLFNEYEFDGVFHLAALSEVRKCQSDAKLAFDVNVGGVVNVLEACRLYGDVDFVVVSSSDKAYGKGELPYEEDDKLNGEAIYEASKSSADLIARAYYYNYELPVVVTRCCNLYGGGDMNFSRVVPNNIRKIINGERPMIWEGCGVSIRELIYVEDAVGAYLSLIENIDITKGNAYNIGSGEKITIEELLQLLLRVMDSNLTIEYKPKSFPEISNQYLSSNKIINDTGWKPSTSLADGLMKSVEFYRDFV